MTKDPINDASHDIRNVIQGLMLLVKRLDIGWTILERELRNCPHADEEGCPCMKIKKAADDGAGRS